MARIKRNREKRPRSKLRNFVGFLRFLILLTALLLFGGFIAFVRSVTHAQPPDPLPSADGIVVLTGDGGRMAAAGKLLKDKKAERLLVSGVSREVSDTDLEGLLGVESKTLTCCVDIDIAAEDTLGNARETAIWASALGYEHIILVTSDYHMPRAKLEITTATSGIRITPYPVRSGDGKSVWSDGRSLKLLWREYAKLLVIYLRDSGARPDSAPQPVPAPTDAMRESQDPPIITGPETPLETPSPIEDETP